MEATKELKGTLNRGAARSTRRFDVSLPVASARVLEAAAILGGFESIEAFIVEAAVEKSVRLNSEEFQQRIRSVLVQDTGTGKGKKGASPGGSEA